MIFIFLCLWWFMPGTLGDLGHDDCDWKGSGLELGKGVRPVYLRCSQGSIHWNYPLGALRIVLRLGASGRDFQGCLGVDSGSSGATVYLEGHRTLRPLHSLNDVTQHPQLPRCFSSVEGQVALYVEAQPSNSLLEKRAFTFRYELTKRQKQYSECRPCTEEEMIFLFCTSDFVVRGTISSLYHNNALQRTELTVRGRQIFTDTEPATFSPDVNNNSSYGELHRPLECGTKAGRGEFLFMGRRRLGNPVITCAPRWAEWKRVKRKALLKRSADCLLE